MQVATITLDCGHTRTWDADAPTNRFGKRDKVICQHCQATELVSRIYEKIRAKDTNVGTEIRRMRKSIGITQRELGRRMGISAPGVARWERPTYAGYTTKKLAAMAGVCGYELVITFKPNGGKP